MILKNCKYIITQDKERSVLKDLDILIEGKEIKRIGKVLNQSDEIIDCSDKIIIPGFTNAHAHAGMTIFRGLYDDDELFDWLRKINKLEEKLSYDLVYSGAKLSIMEMLSKGIVAFIDTYFFPEATILASHEYGIRLVSGRVLEGSNLKNRMEENDALIKKQDELFKVVADPYAIYANSEENLREIMDYAKKRNLRINMHAAETRHEVFDCYQKNKKYVIEYLDSIGFLQDSILAHCGWITSNEINILKERNATVVHNPVSNMKLASHAFFPFSNYKEKEVCIALGTDSAASNNSLNLFDEMKTMALLNKNNHWDASLVKAQDALDSATLNGAKATGFNNGSIEEGKLADLFAINAKEIELQPLNDKNIISNLVYSFNSPVEFTIINGNIVFRKEMLKQWQEEADKISQKINLKILTFGKDL